MLEEWCEVWELELKYNDTLYRPGTEPKGWEYTMRVEEITSYKSHIASVSFTDWCIMIFFKKKKKKKRKKSEYITGGRG